MKEPLTYYHDACFLVSFLLLHGWCCIHLKEDNATIEVLSDICRRESRGTGLASHPTEGWLITQLSLLPRSAGDRATLSQLGARLRDVVVPAGCIFTFWWPLLCSPWLTWHRCPLQEAEAAFFFSERKSQGYKSHCRAEALIHEFIAFLDFLWFWPDCAPVSGKKYCTLYFQYLFAISLSRPAVLNLQL